MKRAMLIALVVLASPGAASAQAGTTTVEVSGQVQSISGPYQGGSGFGVRARHEAAADTWTAFAEHHRRFGDAGLLAGLSNTHTYNPSWYSYLGAAGSTGGVFLPRYRFDGQLARKLGADQRWVVTASLTTSGAHDGHRDAGGGVGLIRYFSSGLIVDAATLINHSSPGGIVSARYVLATTYGRNRAYYASARASWGGEAYQQIGSNAALVDFRSTEVSARYQRWLVPGAGATVSAEYYDNPYYHRVGLYLTLFKQFGP